MTSKSGIPTAILYMTTRMRYNLLRYGNIMFLDGQKRRYNNLDWPYIGPVIKNSDNRIGVTCEAIVTSEDIDTYTWVLKAMLSIEPRWSFSNLQLIYADRLVSKRLLVNLGIEDSCILHGDYFHLYKENWPKSTNFGTSAFKLIKPFLSLMLLSETVGGWERAYENAKNKLGYSYPSKIEVLDKIHDNPEYYAGYVTRNILGNLSLNGSTPAEQNHSSIVSFNGDKMLGCICDHVKALCERQQQLSNKENELEVDYMVKSHRYIPTLDGRLGVEESSAREVLSNTPFKEYFIKQLKSTDYLDIHFNHILQRHNIWPSSETFDPLDEDHIVINVGQRCCCWRRIDFNIQCKHELKINPEFKKEHWGNRWYTRKQFNKLFPNLSTFKTSNEIIDLQEDDNESEKTIHQVVYNPFAIDVDNEVSNITVSNSIIDSQDSNVTYGDIKEVALDLCRTVSADKTLCKKTYTQLHEWIEQLRSGNEFQVNFQCITLPSVVNENYASMKLPQAAVITPLLPGNKRKKRFKSSQEIKRTATLSSYKTKKNRYSSQMQNNNDDDDFVVAVRSKKYKCMLCRQPGCTQWKCNILQDYEKIPGRILQKGNRESRDKLVDIIDSVDNSIICRKRSKNDERIIHNEFPTKTKALIIHFKWTIFQNVAYCSPQENTCLECTLLGEKGLPIEYYDKALFHRHCVKKYINKSYNNLIVDNLS